MGHPLLFVRVTTSQVGEESYVSRLIVVNLRILDDYTMYSITNRSCSDFVRDVRPADGVYGNTVWLVGRLSDL